MDVFVMPDNLGEGDLFLWFLRSPLYDGDDSLVFFDSSSFLRSTFLAEGGGESRRFFGSSLPNSFLSLLEFLSRVINDWFASLEMPRLSLLFSWVGRRGDASRPDTRLSILVRGGEIAVFRALLSPLDSFLSLLRFRLYSSLADESPGCSFLLFSAFVFGEREVRLSRLVGELFLLMVSSGLFSLLRLLSRGLNSFFLDGEGDFLRLSSNASSFLSLSLLSNSSLVGDADFFLLRTS